MKAVTVKMWISVERVCSQCNEPIRQALTTNDNRVWLQTTPSLSAETCYAPDNMIRAAGSGYGPHVPYDVPPTKSPAELLAWLDG